MLNLAVMLSAPAWAGPCDDLVDKVEKTDAEQIPALYREVHACDKGVAEKAFGSFMRKSTDTGLLTDLSLASIDLESYDPVWNMMEQIPDYAVRDEIARRVGALCQDNVGVLPFLRGGYYAMNERAFGMWKEAFLTCGSNELTDWLKSEIASPPARTYDDKYNSLLTATVKRLKSDALPPLERAAIAAAERGGPFTNVLEKMQEAARPGGMGSEMSTEDKAKLAKSLVQVGKQVRPEQAALVADRLYQTGHKVEAAGLLKVVYGDRVQEDGTLLYAVTATEHCGGNAVVHVIEVFEPSKRWSVVSDVEGPARALKQRLKCDTDEDWPVIVSAMPMRDSTEVDNFAATIERKWADKNLVVKLRKEKPIRLP